MKTFQVFMVWASVLFVQVLSNNKSINSELIFFYYVYKMQVMSGVTQTMAVGCRPTGGHKYCFFDEFVRYTIDPDTWAHKYRPKPVDHTDEPDLRVYKSLDRGKPGSARYCLDKLCSKFTGDTSMPEVIKQILHEANDAVTNGGTKNGDLKSAVEYANEATKVREKDLLPYKEKELEGVIGKKKKKYVAFTESDIDLDSTVENINREVSDGKMTAAEGEALKRAIQDFSKTYGVNEGVPEDQKTMSMRNSELHVVVVHEFRGVGNELGKLVEEETDSSSSAGSPSAPPEVCDTDFITFGKRGEKSFLRSKLGVRPISKEVITGRRVLALRKRYY